MKIRRRVQKYIFIISFAVLAGFMHQNTYAETRTNIQLYVPDDNQNNRQEIIRLPTGLTTGRWTILWQRQVIPPEVKYWITR